VGKKKSRGFRASFSQRKEEGRDAAALTAKEGTGKTNGLLKWGPWTAQFKPRKARKIVGEAKGN